MTSVSQAPPDVAILCGGRGERLRSVLGDLPKPLAPIQGRPFLEWLVRDLAAQGFRRAILCTGYGREQIRAHFARLALPIEIVFSEEEAPLGTGGALAQAARIARTESLLGLNGDSFTALDLVAMVREHERHPERPLLAVVPANARQDAGSVRVENGWVKAFGEKRKLAGAGFHSAGIYLIPVALLRAVSPGQNVSIEQELLPEWALTGLRAWVHEGELTDIGTPERLERARTAQAIPGGWH